MLHLLIISIIRIWVYIKSNLRSDECGGGVPCCTGHLLLYLLVVVGNEGDYWDLKSFLGNMLS